MISKIPSIILLLTSMVLISSGNKLSLPTNYTWPLNSKRFCFAARFNLSLNVAYTKIDGSKASAKIPLDNSTFESYSATCSAPANVHQLVISMLNSLTSIIFNFAVDDKNVTSLTKVYGYITVDNDQTYITNYTNETAGQHKFSSGQSLFATDREKSFRCDTPTTITGFDSNTSLVVTSIDVQNLRIQPFVDDSQDFNGYNTETVCKADSDKNSNLVPIIVGGCLAVLVVIVLVAYLIGRRRNRNGYQSV
jgi:hypothetical protein